MIFPFARNPPYRFCKYWCRRLISMGCFLARSYPSKTKIKCCPMCGKISNAETEVGPGSVRGQAGLFGQRVSIQENEFLRYRSARWQRRREATARSGCCGSGHRCRWHAAVGSTRRATCTSHYIGPHRPPCPTFTVTWASTEHGPAVVGAAARTPRRPRLTSAITRWRRCGPMAAVWPDGINVLFHGCHTQARDRRSGRAAPRHRT